MYYESQSTIGKLFRLIDLPAVQIVRRAVHFQQRHMEHADSDDTGEERARVLVEFCAFKGPSPRRAAVWDAVRRRVAAFIDTSSEACSIDEVFDAWQLYCSYVSQLRGICAECTLTYGREAMLTEEEAVVSRRLPSLRD